MTFIFKSKTQWWCHISFQQDNNVQIQQLSEAMWRHHTNITLKLSTVNHAWTTAIQRQN